MDQRFWGKRVHELGVGPEPVHIFDFPHVCVDLVNEALRPESSWAMTAKEVAPKVLGESEDGVAENVRAFLDFATSAKWCQTEEDEKSRKKVIEE